MINQDKPTQGVPETYLEVGSGFDLLIGGGYRFIVGVANVLSGMTNTSKVSSAELWSTITTTWATETRTWLDCSSLFDNTSKPTTSIVNTAKP